MSSIHIPHSNGHWSSSARFHFCGNNLETSYSNVAHTHSENTALFPLLFCSLLRQFSLVFGACTSESEAERQTNQNSKWLPNNVMFSTTTACFFWHDMHWLFPQSFCPHFFGATPPIQISKTICSENCGSARLRNKSKLSDEALSKHQRPFCLGFWKEKCSLLSSRMFST